MNSVVNITVDPQLFNLAKPSWDTFLVIFFVALVIVYSFFANRERLAVMLLSTYSAIAVLAATPILSAYMAGLPADGAIPYRLGIFLGVFLTLFLLFSYNMSLKSDMGQSLVHAVALSFLQVGLFLSVVLSYLPPDIFSSQFVKSFFIDDLPRSLWMVAPVAAMLLMHRRPSSPGQQ
jgi:FtsH-binding integral membrane protein